MFHRISLGVFSLGLLLVLSFSSCKKSPGGADVAKPGKVLAKGAGFKVTQGDVDQMLTLVPPQAREFYGSPQMRKQLVDRLVANEVMYTEAIKRGIDKKPEVSAQLESAKRSVYAKYLLDDVIEQRTKDDVLKAKFDQEKEKYSQPEVKAAHILMKDKAKVEKVYQRVKKGDDFAKLAKEFSEDPTNKDKGGDLGWFSADKMVKPFSDTAFAMKPGEISKPVETQFGFHIIKLEDRREGMPFEDVKERIKADLSRTIRTDYLEELKAQAKVEYLDDSLKTSAPPPMPGAGMMPPPAGGGGKGAPPPAAKTKAGEQSGHEGHGH